MKDFDEEGIKQRYLFQYSKLKEKLNVSDEEIGKLIGVANAKYFITYLVKGTKKISLEILVRTHNKYPEIDLQYILFSTEIPKFEMVDLRGTTKNEKTGRKPTGKMNNYQKYVKKVKDLPGNDSPGIE